MEICPAINHIAADPIIAAPTSQIPDVYAAPLMLETTLLTENGAFDALAAEWDELLEASEQRVFFLRWFWNRTWWKTYAPAGSKLFLIVCRDAQGRLVGLAPFYWQERSYCGPLRLREINFLGTGIDVKTSEYLDIIARRGYEQAVGEAVAATLRQQTDWDRLWLWHIPAGSAVLSHFQQAVGQNATTKSCDKAYFVDTSMGWEKIKGGFGRNLRGNIDRLIRQIFKTPDCCFQCVETADELEPALDDFIKLHQARWQAKGQPGSFVIPHFESFLREIAQHSLANGRLRLWRLILNGQCVASLLAFVDFAAAHYFQSGFDPVSTYALGNVLIGLSIQASIKSAEIQKFDFMGGNSSYKASWTQTVLETVELEALRPNFRSRLYLTAQKIRAVARPLRQALRTKVAAWRQTA